MASGFKLPSGGTITGEYGTSSYGSEAYGGSSQQDVFVIPTPQEGSDDLERSFHRFVGEIVHRRAGVIVGARTYAEVGRWRIQYQQIEQADLDKFLPFFRARRFLFIPDTLDETAYYTVHWLEDEFVARQRRGGPYQLQFTIEEVA